MAHYYISVEILLTTIGIDGGTGARHFPANAAHGVTSAAFFHHFCKASLAMPPRCSPVSGNALYVLFLFIFFCRDESDGSRAWIIMHMPPRCRCDIYAAAHRSRRRQNSRANTRGTNYRRRQYAATLAAMLQYGQRRAASRLLISEIE